MTIQAAISLEVTFGTRRFRIASNDGSAIVCGSLEERGQTELRILRLARRCWHFGGLGLQGPAAGTLGMAERRTTDPGKLALAARLRRETSLPLKWIAARGRLGTSKSANANRHHWRQAHPEPAITMQSGSATKGHDTTKTNHPMG